MNVYFTTTKDVIMLTPEIIQTVKDTAPVLAEHGEQITDLFYAKLFAAHPELKNIFNMANQAKGEQSKALAASVFMYASKIDELEALGPLVTRIANKHASLQIQPEHYPIVGKYLLEAVQDHLSLEADHHIIQAWTVAYGFLAKIFVDTEEKIYSDNEQKIGGWRGFKEFVINDIQTEAKEVKSFYLMPVDQSTLPTFIPGQYIGVKVKPDNNEFDEIRQYSLSDAPGKNYFRITIKSESQEVQIPGIVSNYLHQAKIGDRVWLQPPTGDFALRQNDLNKVFIAGGVGITPVLSMLLEALKTTEGKEITFIQCCRDAQHEIMGEKLKSLQAKHGFNYKVAYQLESGGDHQGYLTKQVLEAWLPSTDNDIYFCGPKIFMSSVNQLCLDMGHSQDNLHYEIFGPTTALN